MAELYTNIEHFMKKKGYSLHKLSEISGVPYTCLSNVKNGRNKGMSTKNLTKLAYALEVSLEELTSGEKEKEPPETDDPLTKELIEKIMQLSKENSMKAMDFVDYLLASGHNQEP